MRCLITVGSGFVGRALASFVLAQGYDVRLPALVRLVVTGHCQGPTVPGLDTTAIGRSGPLACG